VPDRPTDVPVDRTATTRGAGGVEHQGRRVAVLVSGSGTILEALVGAGVPVTVVLADRPCRALEVARDAGLPGVLVDRRARGGAGPRARLVAMAGFGTVMDQPVHDAYPGRILNTHPALLPAFPGWHAVADALAAGARVTGCTVHVATLEMDAGPVLAQEEVEVSPDDTVETLHERIKQVERTLYPATVLRAINELTATGSLDQMAARAGAGATKAKVS
jgi:phosphoribosylglycinamide formyltransferase 1